LQLVIRLPVHCQKHLLLTTPFDSEEETVWAFRLSRPTMPAADFWVVVREPRSFLKSVQPGHDPDLPR